MGFVDTVMVGRLGPTDLAAVSLGSAVFFGLLVFALGILVGVGPLVAQAVGARDERTVEEVGRHGLLLALLLSPVVLVGIALVREQLDHFIADAEVVVLARGYLGAVSWSVLPFLAFVGLRSWLEALNRPLVVTVFALLTVGVNVIGNYAFVYGEFGFPALGAVGTGYATSMSNAFLFIGLLCYTLSRSQLRSYQIFKIWRGVQATRLLELLRVGGPIGISFGIEVGLFSVTAVLVGGLGATALAAHQIVIQCAAMAFMLPLSVALASTIRVGNLVGADRCGEARQAGWLGVALGAGIMVVTATAFVLLPEQILSLFMGEIDAEEQEVASLATNLLLLAGAFQIADGIQGTAAGALRGLKDTFGPMLIGLFSYWGVGLTSGYMLSKSYGVYGFWMGLVAGLAMAAVLLVGRWRVRAAVLK